VIHYILLSAFKAISPDHEAPEGYSGFCKSLSGTNRSLGTTPCVCSHPNLNCELAIVSSLLMIFSVRSMLDELSSMISYRVCAHERGAEQFPQLTC
jgi:hypothetical protein